MSEVLAPLLPLVPSARPTSFDREYWLGHCEGFRVEYEGGALGFVDEVRSPPDFTEKRMLAVRAGMLGRRLLLVPAEEVAFIVPRAERIWLKSSPRILGSEARGK